MTWNNRRGAVLLVATVCMAGMLIGCGAGGTSFPEKTQLELLDGTLIDADRDGGAPSLASSAWDFFRQNDNGTPGLFLVHIEFGPDGNLTGFEENTLAAEVFGQTIILDGERHDTTQEGVSYAGATYGGEAETGLGFEVRVAAYYSAFQVAEGYASAIGEFTDEDTIEGMFTFRTEVSDLAESFVGPEANQDDEFAIIAYRATE